MKLLLRFALIGATSISAIAATPKPEGFFYSGSVTGEMRVHTEEPFLPVPDDKTFFPSIYGSVNFGYAWEDGGQWKIEFTPFARYDVYDDERTHWDLREANISYKTDGWDVLLGAHTVFWGKVESRRLVNIINQVDLVENFDEESYLGQPMLNVNLYGDWGKLSLFAMTGFRERTYPDLNGRFFFAPFDTEGETYESSDEEWNFDFAVRYENSFDGLDVAASYFHGNSREPQLIPVVLPSGPALQPRYQQIDQIGLEASYALGPVLFKGEAIYRFTDDQPFCLNNDPGLCIGTPDDFFAITAGAEYTIKNPFNDGTDVGILAEVNFDDRNRFNPVTIFDHDVLIGARFTLNDEDDSRILAAAVLDYRNENSYIYLEASRRFGDDLRLSVEARLFNADEIDPLLALDNEDYIQVSLTHYF
jgi:hypothetical protein